MARNSTKRGSLVVMNDFDNVLIKLLILLLIFLISIVFLGCGGRVVTQYKEVYVPVKCEAYVPKKPQRLQDDFLNLQKLLIYTEELEIIINHCVKDKLKGDE